MVTIGKDRKKIIKEEIKTFWPYFELKHSFNSYSRENVSSFSSCELDSLDRQYYTILLRECLPE